MFLGACLGAKGTLGLQSTCGEIGSFGLLLFKRDFALRIQQAGFLVFLPLFFWHWMLQYRVCLSSYLHRGQLFEPSVDMNHTGDLMRRPVEVWGAILTGNLLVVVAAGLRVFLVVDCFSCWTCEEPVWHQAVFPGGVTWF